MEVKARVIARENTEIGLRKRRDWSKLNAQIRSLKFEEVLELEFPRDMARGMFRSQVIITGRRAHGGKFRVETSRGVGGEKDKLQCYLS